MIIIRLFWLIIFILNYPSNWLEPTFKPNQDEFDIVQNRLYCNWVFFKIEFRFKLKINRIGVELSQKLTDIARLEPNPIDNGILYLKHYPTTNKNWGYNHPKSTNVWKIKIKRISPIWKYFFMPILLNVMI